VCSAFSDHAGTFPRLDGPAFSNFWTTGIQRYASWWEGPNYRSLVGVSRGEQALIPALAQYERDMIDYGFHAVRTSLKDMERFHAKSPLALGVTKTLFRTVDRVPLLKSALLGR
jgi:hypothetical protein